MAEQPAGQQHQCLAGLQGRVCAQLHRHVQVSRPALPALHVRRGAGRVPSRLPRAVDCARNSYEGVHEVQAIQYFAERSRDDTLLKHKLMRSELASMAKLMSKADKYAATDSTMRV